MIPSKVEADCAAEGRELLERQVNAVHKDILSLKGYESLQRIGVALYDRGSDHVTTFLQSLDDLPYLGRLNLRLREMGSLRHLAEERGMRVVDEIMPGAPGRLGELYRIGIRSSMTVPILGNGQLFGFIFFNSTRPGFFSGPISEHLRVYAKLISFLLINEIMSVNLVRAVTRTAQEVTRLRDFETATHLDRMSNYARLIAAAGASYWGLSDECIEYIYWFAPLHDIGKVAISDSVLLKPGKLTPAEMDAMKLHVERGVAIIDAIAAEFGSGTIRRLDLARNIIAFHHENFDGSGYPAGAAGHEIPLEGRIVALADVFDALTSDRPYKSRWSNEEALTYVMSLSGSKFDPDCVEFLVKNFAEVTFIQDRFCDEFKP